MCIRCKVSSGPSARFAAAFSGALRRWFAIISEYRPAQRLVYPTTALRVDMTAGQIYSISQATRGYLQQLREPLLIRGYFSAKTHPLLAPLVPQMQDLLREYRSPVMALCA